MDVLDRYNLLVGAAATLLTAVFGAYWYPFAGFLLCNILDWLTWKTLWNVATQYPNF